VQVYFELVLRRPIESTPVPGKLEWRSLNLPVSSFGRSRPAADAAREVVERWLLDGVNVGVGHRRCSRDHSTWLFPSNYRKDRPIDTKTVWHACQKSAKCAGIQKGVHPHTLRHCFATHLYERPARISVPFRSCSVMKI